MEQIVPLLEQLAAELHTTIEFLWQVLINQAQVYVIIYLSRFALLAVSLLGCIWVTKWIVKHFNDDNGNKVLSIVVLDIFLAIAIIVLIIIQLATYSDFLTALLNPEYWALQQILEYIK